MAAIQSDGGGGGGGGGSQEAQRDGCRTKIIGVLKVVKQFSRPATFKSIKIDLFVMRADPFGISQA